MSVITKQKILDNFSDYRSYVSHTLCKNQFFLYIKSKNPEKAFTDPSIWLLLRSEVINLFHLGSSLYGIDCPRVFEDDREKAVQCIAVIDRFSEKKTNSAVDMMKYAELLRDILAGIKERFVTEPFSFNIEFVYEYLKGRTADGLREEILLDMKNKIVPLICSANEDLSLSNENNNMYWQLYPSIMTRIRECLVAAIIEKKDEDFISEIKELQSAFMRCDIARLTRFKP